MTGLARTRALILTYAILSAASYCALLPLWEGFDEFYHYAYVQSLSETLTFPVIGHAPVSRELWTSLDFTPVSHFLQPYFQRPTMSFEEYFRLSSDERRTRRAGLEAIDRGLRNQPSPRDNYEAKQAPLTYALLAPLERVLASAPLPFRVLTLRLLLGMSTVILLWSGTRRLASLLHLLGAMEAAALFVIFSCQMLYSASCHIANDALLLPWFAFFLGAVIASCEVPSVRRAALTGLLMATGLLIKASVLILVPLVFLAPAIVLFRHGRRAVMRSAGLGAVSAATLLALAGPWYLRNVVLYQNLTATNDTTAGIGPKELLQAAVNLPWRESLAATAHTALWTGNNSFTSFSASTLNIVLALLALAVVLYVLRARRATPELVTLAAIALYSAGLLLTALSFFHATHGETNAPMPWYMQVLLAPVIAICFLGLSRWQPWGKWITIVTIVLWAYVAAASWLAKLIPMYAGFADSRAHMRQLLSWYIESSAERNSFLSTLSPAPLSVLYTLLAATLTALLASAMATCFSLSRQPFKTLIAKQTEAPADR